MEKSRHGLGEEYAKEYEQQVLGATSEGDSKRRVIAILRAAMPFHSLHWPLTLDLTAAAAPRVDHTIAH